MEVGDKSRVVSFRSCSAIIKCGRKKQKPFEQILPACYNYLSETLVNYLSKVTVNIILFLPWYA